MSRGRRAQRLVLLLGAAMSIGFATLSVLRPAFLVGLDSLFLDSLVRREVVSGDCRAPLVIGLDDEALAAFGRWPWPRALVARLLEGIAALGPAAIGVDVLFAEPEPVAGGGDPSEGDRALARALARGPFVLGYELTFAPPGMPSGRTRALEPLHVTFLRGHGAPDPAAALWRATGAVHGLPELAHAAGRAGFLNAGLDRDGILRRMPLLIELEGGVYPSLALATAMEALGARRAVLESSYSGERTLRVGERRIPLDDRGRLLLRYRRQTGCPRSLSAAAVLEGRAPRAAVAGRIVFVGATAAGLGESIATPIDPVLPGVAAHALAAGNMVQADFARPGSPLTVASIVLCAGLAGTWACVALQPVGGALLLLAAGLLGWLGSVRLFESNGLVLSPVVPALALVTTFVLLTLVRSLVDERRASEQSRELAATRDFVTESLVSLTSIRDTETGGHLQRTQRYLRILCEAAARHPRFRDQLPPETIEIMSKLAPIHDIGKVGVPDDLLHKPERLTAEQFHEVQKHAAYGRDAIATAAARAGVRNSEFLRVAKDLVHCHHERGARSGYPQGLRGEQIPLAGRLMAIVDVYDALVTRRIYKEPVTHDDAVRLIREGRGSQFDPDLVDVFVSVERSWRQAEDGPLAG